MNWTIYLKGFKAYLALERSLSANTISAYLYDVEKLYQYIESEGWDFSPLDLKLKNFEAFIFHINKMGVGAHTQARIISGVKAFYKYLLMEDLIDVDPTELLEGPKLKRKLPDVLSYSEIQEILDEMDVSNPAKGGHRNKAIIEVLYACGLRVSELTHLRISQYFPEEGYIRVIGKGNKERIVPIGTSAISQIDLYLHTNRTELPKIALGHEDFVFLNRRGKKMTRVMVFLIIKDAIINAGIDKVVSPHTFRHSFATHLVEGGANLRVVQDMLGHESITTTEIYTHLDRSYLRDTLIQFHPSYKNKNQ